MLEVTTFRGPPRVPRRMPPPFGSRHSQPLLIQIAYNVVPLLIVAPVRGLRPLRAARLPTLKVPKPTRDTVLFFFKVDLTPPITASNARAAAALEMSACLAMCSINSDLLTAGSIFAFSMSLAWSVVQTASAPVSQAGYLVHVRFRIHRYGLMRGKFVRGMVGGNSAATCFRLFHFFNLSRVFTFT